MRPTGPRYSKPQLRPQAGIGAGDVVIAQFAHIRRHRLSQAQQGGENRCTHGGGSRHCSLNALLTRSSSGFNR